jgi:hypothetical protein
VMLSGDGGSLEGRSGQVKVDTLQPKVIPRGGAISLPFSVILPFRRLPESPLIELKAGPWLVHILGVVQSQPCQSNVLYRVQYCPQ